MKSILIAAAAALTLGCCTAPAFANPPPPMARGPGCGPRAGIAAALARNHAETPVSRGVSARGALVEVFASTRGTWTLVVTVPGGPSCLIAAGQDWQHLPRPAGTDPRERPI